MLTLLSDLALIKDEDGNTPLHTAAIRGRREILTKLFTTESANELTSSRETVLHLAVKHNRYQALELPIQLVNQYQIGNELLDAVDVGGNTILHLACAGKKSKVMNDICCCSFPRQFLNKCVQTGFFSVGDSDSNY